jgi:hypothetical protein
MLEQCTLPSPNVQVQTRIAPFLFTYDFRYTLKTTQLNIRAKPHKDRPRR